MKIGNWEISARNFSEPIRCVVAEIYSKKNLIGFSYRTIDYRSVFLNKTFSRYLSTMVSRAVLIFLLCDAHHPCFQRWHDLLERKPALMSVQGFEPTMTLFSLRPTSGWLCYTLPATENEKLLLHVNSD